MDARTPQAPRFFTPRRRLPWAHLLRRLLHVEALSCPRCSTPARTFPMTVLAFLTDPAVVERILRHLGLAIAPPALAPARSSEQPLGFPVDPEPDEIVIQLDDGDGEGEGGDRVIRPPP
ncbi:MAG: hypothetical protein GF418_14120 [Chitinivibrionales bacterium]|nr:hypothetical protein [Chitinivibrionales bacterium]